MTQEKRVQPQCSTSSYTSDNSSTTDQLQKIQAELETNFSALRQDLMSELRGAIWEVVGLIPNEMVSPQSSTRAGYVSSPDPTLSADVSSMEL